MREAYYKFASPDQKFANFKKGSGPFWQMLKVVFAFIHIHTHTHTHTRCKILKPPHYCKSFNLMDRERSFPKFFPYY